MSTFKRLTKVFNSSKKILIDDSSKIILMSDCHRGDNSWADSFAHNENLLFTSLNYYYNQGFTYIEVGDGDELWENRKFSRIRESHSHIFWIMRKFFLKNRLYMIWGNHDMMKKDEKYLKNNLYYYYDDRQQKNQPLFKNIETHEGIILVHKEKKYKIFVVHGHQGDILNDYLWFLSKFLVRYVWKPLELYSGFKDPTSAAKNFKKKRATEKRILEWVKANNQMIITGHTHRPTIPAPNEALYFNVGSCVHPRCITGIEIKNGQISLIKWSIKAKNNGLLYVGRDVIAGPLKLEDYFENNTCFVN
ncbi:metallophosphoesterase [Maledivibacter halophilus]|uniref:UDP-2,3-diacylglucosamine pyrophosphatase LpxH n=1 Tax=Maledivibacter halophilus TaxID=36842 RepID=A0A1T5J7H7_9FIRM|nr:metallophosphoesterase [Maledivibacter halophilus]SKC47329.1 UDP-2,3-diacylglucosamine pyrophosphatase LpxH [Maledivibacter halophilus]